MAHQTIMRKFARWHIWLGWLVGLPVLMWTVTGLVMVWHPIEYVRGNHLRAEMPPVETAGLVLPRLAGEVESITLQSFPDGPGWIVVEADGGRYRYSPEDGRLYNPVSENGARQIAEATFAGDAALETVTYFPADSTPLDLRTPIASWQARFADDTHVYIAAQTGEVLAIRSGWWRVFDFMWGLHIMDLETREDTSHPILVVFAALGVAGSLLGCILMFRRRKAKVKVNT
ncbi:PepSY domain-containing protein [Aurantiacibacter poecillastricola]|uniref:PepSY domain-containing protein n=1 Tax=Aurantiacibacter poecillastricola TaxID=3064385 RepID=UPI00273FE76A|nr:PepSY domain-containing protein [Aurantiacibacter sp. 219JJ12-13]MDP5261636.1 PepSY domain-containing protein [Aurantiacibacter sp. 219JJ12-13]